MSGQGFSRADKHAILAQLCIVNGITPHKNTYAGFIRNIAVSKLGASLAQAKNYTKELTIAYRADQWQSLLGDTQTFNTNTPSLNVQETPLPEMPDMKRLSIREEMQLISENVTPQPVKFTPKTLQTPPNEKPIGKQLAQILHRQAEQDTFDGVGRIILSDARNLADDKHLQIGEVAELFQTCYPVLEVEIRSNVLLVHWNGRGNRVTIYPPIIPKMAPVFNPKEEPL